jgi:hypothetical protein
MVVDRLGPGRVRKWPDDLLIVMQEIPGLRKVQGANVLGYLYTRLLVNTSEDFLIGALHTFCNALDWMRLCMDVARLSPLPTCPYRRIPSLTRSTNDFIRQLSP